MDDDQINITYTFKYPSHQLELDAFCRSQENSDILRDAYNICRNVWKYEENPHADRLSLAEEIGQVIRESQAIE